MDTCVVLICCSKTALYIFYLAIVQINLENTFPELEFWAKEYTFVILTVISSLSLKDYTNLNFH